MTAVCCFRCISATHIRITYSSDSSAYSVSDKKISGRYDDAYPNDIDPSTVTVLGTEFEVLDSALPTLANFSTGETITLLLTTDNKVEGAVSADTLRVNNIGIVTSATSSKTTVELTNGITVSGNVKAGDADEYKDMVVSVSSNGEGYIYLTTLQEQSIASTLNLGSKKLGDATLSVSVKIIDWINLSTAVEVDINDIGLNTVDGSKIYYAEYDLSGKASLIILEDVTGDGYTYGIVELGSKTSSSGSFTVTNTTVTATNSEGSATYTGNCGITNDCIAGVAAKSDGILAGAAILTKASGISLMILRKTRTEKCMLM